MNITDDSKHTFDANARNIWQSVLGGMRDVIRQELVHRQLSACFPEGSLRVLDIGCGQGSQAIRLAHDGHNVTGADPSPEMLGLFKSARDKQPPEVRERITIVSASGMDVADRFAHEHFDVVLCHGVVAYLTEDESSALLNAARQVLKPTGMFSLLTVNGDALAMAPALAGDWDTARDTFDRKTSIVARSGVTLRAYRRDHLIAWLSEHRFTEHAWYGLRVFTDHLGDEPPAEDLDQLIAVEEMGCRTDPYRSVAAFIHTLCKPTPQSVRFLDLGDQLGGVDES